MKRAVKWVAVGMIACGVSGGYAATGNSDDGTTGVSETPFYIAEAGYFGNVVKSIIVNNTDDFAYMRFWLTGTITRTDGSAFKNCSSQCELKLDKKGKKNVATYQLSPGENEILLRIKDYGSKRVVSAITLNGGHSISEPTMVPYAVDQLGEPIVEAVDSSTYPPMPGAADKAYEPSEFNPYMPPPTECGRVLITAEFPPLPPGAMNKAAGASESKSTLPPLPGGIGNPSAEKLPPMPVEVKKTPDASEIQPFSLPPTECGRVLITAPF